MSDDTDGGPDYGRERYAESLQHHPDDVVHEKVALPSALWARLMLEKPASVDFETFAVRLINAGLGCIGGPEAMTVQADITATPEWWEQIRLEVLYHMQTSDNDPETAYWNAINDHVQMWPNPVVDGEVKGSEDVADWIGNDGGADGGE